MIALASDADAIESISDLLILAAIGRAQRHGQTEGVLWNRVREHVGVVNRAYTTRGLRAQANDLVAAGAVRVFRRSGNRVWGLTDEGRRRLTRAGREGKVPRLPEAPQHQAWRLARELAVDRIAPLRAAVGDALAETQVLLKNEEAGAQAWFAQANRLKALCSELGWVTYCLDEWAEPDDGRPDSNAGERRRGLELFGLQTANPSLLP